MLVTRLLTGQKTEDRAVGKMFLKVLFVTFVVFSSVLADGELTILHSPHGINFHGHQMLKSNDLPQIFLAAMGHSTSTINAWNGLTIVNPFNYPKTTIVVVFDGVSSLQLQEQSYPLHVSASGLEKTKLMIDSAEDHFYDENNLITQTGVDGFKLEYLNIGEEAVIEFVNNMGLMQDLKRMVASKANNITVWIQLKGLGQIAQQFGLKSTEMSEALKIAKNTLKQLKTVMEKACGDKFLLAVIANQHRARHTRSIKEGPNEGLDINLSKRYDENYACIFNIILWISIFLIAALISIAVFICTLDPGRDSIIYRMTTQRIKKDN